MIGHPDKAISQRATILAALADGQSLILNPAECRDMTANLAGIRSLGITVRETTSCGNPAIVINGIDGTTLRRDEVAINAGNSATTSRLLIAMLSGGQTAGVVRGNSSLSRRPMGDVIEPLKVLGADIRYAGAKGLLPVYVRGRRLAGGSVDVNVDSAQPVSALLFAATLAADSVNISRMTLARDHTERMLRWTGVDVIESPKSVSITPGRPRAFNLRVPGDPSAAALLAALHLACSEGDEEMTIAGVCLNPRRLGFFRVLRDLGVNVRMNYNIAVDSPEDVGDITVKRAGPWSGVDVRSSRLVQSGIDELPLIAALATQATGPTVIANAAELRSKDTDRINETVGLLRAFGADANSTDDGLLVSPSALIAPGHVVLSADHRIVFAAMVLCVLAGPGTVLSGVDAAATSFPGVFQKLSEFVEWQEVSG